MRRLVVLCFALAACKNAVEPELRCAEKCETRTSARCTERECSRGCAFILDRIVEREEDKVLSCLSRGAGVCDDPAWAECAAKVGIHADGGPGPPPPIPQYMEEAGAEENRDE